MEHVVFYPSYDGTPAFRRVPSLEEAARFVEHLRNAEDVTDFSVHALTPVPLSVRPWYRVEMPLDVPATGGDQSVPPIEPAAPAPVSAVSSIPEFPVPDFPVTELPVAESPVAESPVADMPAAEPSIVEPAIAEPRLPDFPTAVFPAEFVPAEVPAAILPAVEPPVAPAPLEVVEPLDPELAAAVATGRRSLGFFTR
jgi:hypothetical protein